MKEIWLGFLVPLFLFIILAVVIGFGIGKTSQRNDEVANYSLGYAECKANMPHIYKIQEGAKDGK